MYQKLKQQAEKDTDNSTSLAADVDENVDLGDLNNEKAKLKNEAIFRNMTFDNQGNPMNVHTSDPESLKNYQVLPRYKLAKTRKNMGVDSEAINSLKQVRNARRMNTQQL